MHNNCALLCIVHCFSSYLFYALIPFIEHFLKHVVSCTDIYIYIYIFIINKAQLQTPTDCFTPWGDHQRDLNQHNKTLKTIIKF